jgi:hypothetical protein
LVKSTFVAAAAAVVVAALAAVVDDCGGAAVVATAADAVLVVAAVPVVAVLDLLLLPHATATRESEMNPASTSGRLTGFTKLRLLVEDEQLGLTNVGSATVKKEVDAQGVDG